MAKRGLLAYLTIVCGLLVPCGVWPEEGDLRPQEQRTRSSLEVYLDRANQAATESQWLQTARFGVEAVVADWETSAAHLVDQGIDLPAERDRIEGDLAELLRERLVRWLVEQAFARQARTESARLGLAVLQANYRKLYRTDENGIIYDDSGDPEIYPCDNLTSDQADWEAMVLPALQSALESWDAHAAALRTELLPVLPDGTATALLDGQFSATEAQYREACRRELETAFQREESRFLYQRRLDQFSLRRKSETQTASSIASQLIADTNAEMQEGIQRLRESLSLDRSATPDGEITVDPAAWQESFQRELDKGMARWSQAERELLLQRAQWERDVADQFLDGEREWSDAYAGLEEARLQWQREISELLDRGQTRWDARRADLTEAIEAARGELMRCLSEESQSLDVRIANLEQLASQAATILRTARSSLDYWTPLLPASELRSGDTEAEREYSFWNGVQATYQGYYREAVLGLADMASEINGGVDLPYGENLDPDNAAGRYLDDYQIALLAAKATAAYWQREMEVAEAVASYAHDSSSSRPTEAESEQSLQSALGAFAAKEEAYEGALQDLERAGDDTEANRQKVQELSGRLQLLDTELVDAKEQYQIVIDLYSTKNDVAFREQLQSRYRELLAISGLAGEGVSGGVQAYADYLGALSRLGLETEVCAAAAAVNRLVEGDPTTGLESLAALTGRLARAREWRFDPGWIGADSKGDFLSSTASLGLAPDGDSPAATLYAELSDAFDSYAAAPDPQSQAAALLGILGRAHLLICQLEVQTARRLAEIKLVSGQDLAGWAAGEGIAVPQGAALLEVREAAEWNLKASAVQGYLDRAMAEKQAFDTIVARGAIDGGGKAGVLALSDGARLGALIAAGDPQAIEGSAQAILEELFISGSGLSGDDLTAEAARRSASLKRVIDAMTAILASDDPDLYAHRAEIRSLAEEDALARAFLSGSGMLSMEGTDYGSMLLAGPARRSAQARYLLDLLTQDDRTAPEVVDRLAEEAFSRLEQVLVDRKIATRLTEDTVAFRNAGAIFAELWADSGGQVAKVEAWLAETAEEIGDLEGYLPESVAVQTRSVVASLIQTLAVEVYRSGGAADVLEARGAVDDLTAGKARLEADLARIEGRSSEAGSEPAALLSALRGIRSILGGGGFGSSADLTVALSGEGVIDSFVSASALAIARTLCAADALDSDIDREVTRFLSTTPIGEIGADPAIAPLMPGIAKELSRAARTLLDKARAIANPDRFDWTAAGDQLRAEYAGAVWNRYAPEWFAGASVAGDGSRDTLTAAVDPARIKALYAIHTSLSSAWSPDGLAEPAWDTFLTATYYDGKGTSLAFDRSLPDLESRIDTALAQGSPIYASLGRTLLNPREVPVSSAVRYFYAAGAKRAVDRAIDGRIFDEQRARDAAGAYFRAVCSAISDEDRAAVAAFVESYFAIYGGGGSATVDAEARSTSWLPLLRGVLDGNTLSQLATTTAFRDVASVDLIRSVAGALVDQGLAGYDFGLLKRVLIDCPLDAGGQDLIEGVRSYSDCLPALDSYLARKMDDEAARQRLAALLDEGADRTFALTLLYTYRYVAAKTAGSPEVDRMAALRAGFRSTYLLSNARPAGELDEALACIDTLRRLSPAERDAWFSGQFLSDAGLDRARAIAAVNLAGRANTDANERLLAVGINYDLAQLGISPEERAQLAGWMLAVAGVRPPSNLDALIEKANGSGAPTLPRQEALLVVLGSPEAALWILKRRIIAGKSIDRYASDVDPDVWAEAQEFRARCEQASGYVATAERSAFEYGAEVSGDGSFSSAVEAGASGAAGTWDDPVFSVPFGATGGEVLDASVRFEAERSKVVLDYVGGAFGEELSAMARSYAGLSARLAFATEVESLRTEGVGSLGYRAYLTDSLAKVSGEAASGMSQYLPVNFPSDADPAALIDVPVDAIAGSGGLSVVSSAASGDGRPGPLSANALVEAVNDFAMKTSRLVWAVDVSRHLDRSREASFFEIFEKAATSADASSMLREWDSIGARDFTPSAEATASALQAQESLRRLETEAASAMAEITTIGASLAGYLASSAKAAAEAAAPLETHVESLTSQRELLKARYDAAVSAFKQASESYAARYGAAQGASRDLDAARLELRKAEAIGTFASTGYLRAEAGEEPIEAKAQETASGIAVGVDPDQQLAHARGGLLRAQAALDALGSLYGSADRPADFADGDSPDAIAYRKAFTDYQQQYGAYLAMERLSALLTSAAATQEKRVADAQALVDKGVDDLLAVAERSSRFTATVDLTGDYRGQDFVQVRVGDGALPDFSFGSVSTSTQKSGLIAYLTGIGAQTYNCDREVWVREFSDYLARHSVGSVLSDWSLALQHQLGPSGLNIAASGDAKYRSLFEAYRVDSSQVAVAGGGGGLLSREGVVYEQEFASRARAAYAHVIGDPASKRLYQFFVAMNLLGLVGRANATTQTLSDEYRAEAQQYLVDQLSPRESNYRSTSEALFVSAAVAALWPWTWGIAATCVIAALDYQGKANAIDAYINSDLNGSIQGAKGSVSTAAAALSARTGGVTGYSALKRDLDLQKEILALIEGEKGEGSATEDSIRASLRTAAAAQFGGAAESELADIVALANTGVSGSQGRLDLDALLRLYLDAASGEADSASALSNMCQESRARRDETFTTLQGVAARLEATQSAHEGAYLSEVARLDQIAWTDLDPDAPSRAAAIERLQSAARLAYLDPIFRMKDHLNRLLGLEEKLESLVDPGRHPELQQAQADLFASQQRDLSALYSDRRSALMAVRASEWKLAQGEIANQRAGWQASMQAILERATSQWAGAFQKLEDEHNRWVRQFQREYQERAGSWDATYLRLETNKNAWVQNAADKAATESLKSARTALGQSADNGIREAESLVVCDLDLKPPDPRRIVAYLLDGNDFARLLESGRILERTIPRSDPHIFARLGPALFDTSSVLQRAAELDSLTTEEIGKHVSRIAADGARKSVAEAAGRMNDQIAEANRSVADALRHTLTGAGFTETENRFERKTVVGSTLNSPIFELHKVPAYEPYLPKEAIRTRVDLSDATLLSLSARGIQAQVDSAVRDMQRQLEAVFGTRRTEGSSTLGMGDGAFGEWVGAAPEMAERPDAGAALSDRGSYLSESGSGQLAAVMTPFLWSQLKEGAGWAQVAMPVYDQKLWDDRGAAVKAPTLRTIADVGAGAIGTVLGGGIAGLIVGLAEKGWFAAADVGNGMMSWDEGLVSVGKDFLRGALSLGTGAFGSLLSRAATDLSTVGTFFAGTVAAGLTQAANAVSQGAIDSIAYHSGTGFAFDQRTYLESFAGRDAVAGYLGAMAGSASGALLSGDLSGFVELDARRVASVASLGDDLVSTGVQYAAAGQTPVHLLSLADLSGKSEWNAGLLELHLGGEAATLNVGTGGTAIGVGALRRAVEGMEAFSMQQRIRWYNALGGVAYAGGYTGSRDAGIAMRESYSFGDAAARLQLGRFLGGQDKLRVGYSMGAAGETTIQDRIRTVDLVTLGRTGDIPSQLAAGIVLQHEAYRNGADDGLFGQQAETAAAVLGHMGMALRMAADPQYSESIVSLFAQSPRLRGDVNALAIAQVGDGAVSLLRYAATAYDSSGDYWLLRNDGTLVYDGSGWLRDQAGNLVTDARGLPIGAGGVETGLLDVLGERGQGAREAYTDDQRARAQKLMVASGLVGSGGTIASTMWSGLQVAGVGLASADPIDLTSVNMGKALDMDAVMRGWGSSVATEVFLNRYYQVASQTAIAGLSPADLYGSAASREIGQGGLTSPISDRFGNLLTAMQGLYGGRQILFERSTLRSLSLSQSFGPSDLEVNGKAAYRDYQHKGIDIAGPIGTPEYSLLSGRVEFSGRDSQAGNTAIVDLGFLFEGKFETTGIYSQFMHMDRLPSVYAGQMVAGDTLLGYMGQTGLATGSHLHFQLMGAHGGSAPDSPQWSVYQPRRDVLLKYLGAPPAKEWTTRRTSTLNYWNKDFLNFYFNTTRLAERYKVAVGGTP